MSERTVLANAPVVHSPGGLPKPPPLTLYVHLPWCGRKCPYCDFNSHKAPAQLPEKQYIDALLRDLEGSVPAVWGRPLHAIFIGGGTPSLFSPAAMDLLLSHVRALFNLTADTEVTMEANPDSSDVVKFKEFRAAGVNRLSLGVQSFNDDALRRLQRLHDGDSSRRAAAAAVTAFDNVNMDLMHALPAQTVDAACDDVRIAVEFAPNHLSLYQLTLESGTPFFRSPPPQLPDDDERAACGDAVAQIAAAAGYRQYEVSAYAKEGRQCRHNLNYWRFGDYLGVGAGAHGKISGKEGIRRERRIKHPGEYMRAEKTVAEEWTLSAADGVFEFFLNALRLTDGFPASLIDERIGGFSTAVNNRLHTAEQEGFIRRDNQRICPTDKGRRFLNDLLAIFLPGE